MLLWILVGCLLVAAMVAIQVAAASLIELAPECQRCAVPTDSVGEECQHLGGGWLRSEQIYSCPLCLATLRREYVVGPGDSLDAG